MRVRYNRKACAGWFQCVQKWDEFDMDLAAGKADLDQADETDEGLFVREVPVADEEDAIASAKACPIDAIEIYDDDGMQIQPGDE